MSDLSEDQQSGMISEQVEVHAEDNVAANAEGEMSADEFFAGMERESERFIYHSPKERFDSLCNLLIGLVLRYIRRFSERLLTDRGELSPYHGSVREILHVAGIEEDTNGTAWLTERNFPSIGDVEMQLDGFQAVIEKRIELSYTKQLDDILMPEKLQSQFQLSSDELLLLCAIAAPQLNQSIARFYRLVSGVHTTLFPGWFYADLLSTAQLQNHQICAMLKADRQLRMYSLIETVSVTELGSNTPVSSMLFYVPERVTSFLIGENDNVNIAYANIWRHQTPRPVLYLPEDFKKSLSRQLKRLKPRIGLFATNGFGRKSYIREVAAAQNVNVIEVDLAKCMANESLQSFQHHTGLWFREARLSNAWMVFKCDNIRLQDEHQNFESFASHFQSLINKHPGTICVIANAPNAQIYQLFGAMTEIDCRTPARSVQPELWRHALNSQISGERLEQIVELVSSSYCLTMGEICHTVQACMERLGGNEITAEGLLETLRTTRGRELEGLAELKSTPLGLNDIILSDEARKTIDEILNYARYSDMVCREWEFSNMTSVGGLSVLFSGPPGTGKTLTAGVLAHELRRALYVVDISRVVDKYIGETEKRLAKIFDHAQSSQAILLFDEADSLFAKRTNVKSSNDRYANLEVNYLLQRLESYPGISILTTNHADSLDEALARRIQFKIAFPMPDAAERAKIWALLLPKKAHNGDISFDALGEEFEMSGGHIKNAVFRACIEAASCHQKVTHDMLWSAGIHEYREMGHVVRDIEDKDTRWRP